MAVDAARAREATTAHPTLAEFLATDRLRLHLVHGSASELRRRIRWVHSTELLDPARYLRGGELVCTVGTTLLDPSACRRFVDALAAVDAAGMCFGVGDVHQQTPDAVVEACRDRGLVLIEVPHGVRFIALSEFLAEYRMAAESEMSARGERLVARLLGAVRRGAQLDDLAGLAAADLGGHLLVHIDDTVLAAGPGSDEGTEVQAVVGDSVLVRWTGTETAPTVDLLTQIGRVLDVACFERETERRRQRERVGQLISLVADGLADVAALLPHLEHAALDTGTLTVSAWPPGTGQLLAGRLPDALVGEAPDAAFAVTADAADVRRAAEQLTLACGFGSSVSLGSLARSIAEARACLELARRYGRLVGPSELTSLDGLLEQQPRGRLDPFVSQLILPLVQHDRGHRGQLVDTLRTFFRVDGSLQDTARTHYLHVNTVRHRLGRIRELTGRDPLAFDDRIALAVALWAYERGADRAVRRSWTR